MAKKRAHRSHPGGDSMGKKSQTRHHKTANHVQSPSQSNQPYEQDIKRRVGQFVGAESHR